MINIFLTCTVYPRKNISWLKQRDHNERIRMYLEIIRLWLDNTDPKIIVIENSGYSFPELNDLKEKFKERFKLITFDYNNIQIKDKEFLEHKQAKGHHELYAINYAFKNSDIIDKHDIIFKITGRYFIPEFKNYINNLKDENKVFVQNTVWRGYYRCEILGCHYQYFNQLFEYPSPNDMIEEEYTKRINKIDNKFILPRLKLHKKTQQGVGTYLEYL